MIPFIVGGIAVVTLIIAALSEESELKISSNSNCHDEFVKLSENLLIPQSKKKQIATARAVLQNKIRDYFKCNTNIAVPSFYIQGSTKHGTLIRKQDDSCDIDVGIYFQAKPDILPSTIQSHIFKAIGNHTNETATIKNKCVRIQYANQFHVDLPIYYFDSATNEYHFGTKDNQWQLSDPKLFTIWVKENVSVKPQMVRIVRYFKAWADVVKAQKKYRMPSGLAFTIWISNCYKEDERDDVSFLKTAIQISNSIKNVSIDNWTCNIPVAPYDNVVSKLTSEQKTNFLDALNELLNTSIKIIKSETKEGCVENWRSVFGKWFP